jgi:sarcosine oxidase subunit gamma
MAERPPEGLLSLRGEAGDAAFLGASKKALGFALPEKPNSTTGNAQATAFWLGPSEWLLATSAPVVGLEAALAEALAGSHHALNDVADGRTVLRLSGSRARNLLAKATSLDLHPSVFRPGDCAQTTLARTGMLLHQIAEDPEAGPVYEIYVQRSYADYAWRWLEAAAAEYGFRAIEAGPCG